MHNAPCLIKETCDLMTRVKLLPALRNSIKSYFCDRHFEQCARIRLQQEKKPVPYNLLPNNKLIQADLMQDNVVALKPRKQ
jgi:hypothetical protein